MFRQIDATPLRRALSSAWVVRWADSARRERESDAEYGRKRGTGIQRRGGESARRHHMTVGSAALMSVAGARRMQRVLAER